MLEEKKTKHALKEKEVQGKLNELQEQQPTPPEYTEIPKICCVANAKRNLRFMKVQRYSKFIKENVGNGSELPRAVVEFQSLRAS